MKLWVTLLLLVLAFVAGIGTAGFIHDDRCLDAGGAVDERGLCRGLE